MLAWLHHGGGQHYKQCLVRLQTLHTPNIGQALLCTKLLQGLQALAEPCAHVRETTCWTSEAQEVVKYLARFHYETTEIYGVIMNKLLMKQKDLGESPLYLFWCWLVMPLCQLVHHCRCCWTNLLKVRSQRFLGFFLMEEEGWVTLTSFVTLVYSLWAVCVEWAQPHTEKKTSQFWLNWVWGNLKLQADTTESCGCGWGRWFLEAQECFPQSHSSHSQSEESVTSLFNGLFSQSSHWLQISNWRLQKKGLSVRRSNHPNHWGPKWDVF